MTQAQTPTPLAVDRDEGEAIWWFGSLAVIKASAADTGGAMSLIEITEPPNSRARSTCITARRRASTSSRAGDDPDRRPDHQGQGRRLPARPAGHPAQVRHRSRGLPDALHHDPRRVRRPGPGHGRAGGEPDPPRLPLTRSPTWRGSRRSQRSTAASSRKKLEQVPVRRPGTVIWPGVANLARRPSYCFWRASLSPSAQSSHAAAGTAGVTALDEMRGVRRRTMRPPHRSCIREKQQSRCGYRVPCN